MSNRVVTTNAIRVVYVVTLIRECPGMSQSDAEAVFEDWFATVRPNPDSAAQVEAVARALCEQDACIPDKFAWISVPETAELVPGSFWQLYVDSARAVLEALARTVDRG